jgi:hypothetical protein
VRRATPPPLVVEGCLDGQPETFWLRPGEAEASGYLVSGPGRRLARVRLAWLAWCEAGANLFIDLCVSDPAQPALLCLLPSIGRELTEESYARLVVLLFALDVDRGESGPGALWAELPPSLAEPVAQLLAGLMRLGLIQTRPASPGADAR